MKNPISLLSLVAVVLSGCSMGPEQAEDGSAQPSETEALTTARQRHCVLNADTHETRCYSSFTSAISAATGGRIADAPANAKTALNDKALTARIDALGLARGATTYDALLVATFYWDIDFGGATFSVVRGSQCTGPTNDIDYVIDFATINALGWNDQISSFQGYNGCWPRVWEHDCGQGLHVGFTSSDSNLVDDDMNDKTSCIELS